MKAAWSIAAALVALFVVGAALADKKEDKKDSKKVTLEGMLQCGKCSLKETDECSNVLVVKKGGKTTNYYLKDDGKKADYHVCSKSKKAKVTGTVVKKDDKMWIEDPKVEFVKKEE